MNRSYDSARSAHRHGGVAITAVSIIFTGVGLLAFHHPSSLLPFATVGAGDGAIRDGQKVSVFDKTTPAIQKTDPSLLEALRRAARNAAADGVTFRVTSGWRSLAYQNQLFKEAIRKDGSRQAAERWVATPETSAHVLGDAVDIGPLRADDWLAKNGRAYGLCQIYANEVWHYELRPAAVDSGCPTMYADPTHDPRMRLHAQS